MQARSDLNANNVRAFSKANASDPEESSFVPLTMSDIREAFAVPAEVPPILSLDEAAALVKLRPQTLKRKVSEGLYAKSVVRAKPATGGRLSRCNFQNMYQPAAKSRALGKPP